jgi:hypothetical protein
MEILNHSPNRNQAGWTAAGFRAFLFSVLFFGLFGNVPGAWAQDDSQQLTKIELMKGAQLINPASFEFDIPPGQLYQAADRNGLVVDVDSQQKVAKVYVQVGENFIMLLPDGRLAAFKQADVELTDRPFRADSGKEIADRLRDDYFKGFQFKVTARYVYVYNTSEAFAEATSRVIETMMRGVMLYAKAQRIKVSEPEVPLIVTMFRTEAEFQRYKQMPEGVAAYYNIINNQVVLFEESDLGRLDRELGIKQTISTIAHEGAHQILHNIGVQKRLSIWPMWLTEGMAEFYAPTETGSDLKWRGAGKINDFRMLELESLFGSKTDLALDGEVIRQTVTADRLTSSGYASAWSLIHYLAKSERSNYNGLVNQLSELPPLQGFVSRESHIKANQEMFEAAFGNDWVKLEEDLIDHLKRQRYKSPFSKYPHYVAFVIYSKNGKPVKRVNTFLNPTSAAEWYTELLNDLPEESRNSANGDVRRFDNRDSAMLYTNQWLSQ